MNNKGITIIEAVVATGLTFVLLGALMHFLAAGYPISRTTMLQAQVNETARLQLRRIAREIRQARTSERGDYPLVEMLPQKIVFFADVNANGTIERVRYELKGTELERGIIVPSGTPPVYDEAAETVTVVAVNIQNDTEPIFTYYSGDYPADTEPLAPAKVTDVTYIQFRLIIDVDPNQDPPPIDIVSQVQLRSLKTNLGQEVVP